MREIIRSGQPGRCALVLCCGLSVAIGLATSVFAQQPATAESAAAAAAKDSAKPPAVIAADDPKPADAKPVDASKPAAEVPEVAAPQPVKGKSANSKKVRQSKDPLGGGMPSVTGIDDKPYIIGPEDVLFLNVLHQPDVTGSLAVRPDGFISVRFAGEIKAAGLTTQQLSDEVADKLTKYFNHPEVNIQVVRIVSKKYYVSGEIKKPGAYTLSTPKTIFEALIEAGGPAEFAKKKAIYVLRGKQKIPFNFADVSKGKNLQQNIRIENGDVIVVP